MSPVLTRPRRLTPSDIRLDRVRDAIAMRSPVALASRFDPTFTRRAHGDLISDALLKAAAGDADRVLITTPPQVGKSTTAAVWGAFWWLVNNPSDRMIVASYAASLAIKRGKAVRKLIKEHGGRYGLHLEPGSSGAEDWSLTTGGGMRCVGVDGGATGHGADVVIADDLHKSRKEAESLVIRDNVDSFWSSSLLTRLAPGAPVILVMTLWHPDDIGGRVLEREGDKADGGRWLVLKCPAFASSEHDPLGRAPGEPLPHPLIPEGDTAALVKHWENAKSTVSVRDWFALFMCDPRPVEGALLTAAILRERRHLTDVPPATVAGVAVDPSGGGNDTCGIIGGHIAGDGRLYVTDDWTAVMSVDVWPRKVCELAVKINARRIIVETDFGARMGPTLIRTAWDALNREWNEAHADDPVKTAGPYSGFCPRLVTKRAADMGNKLVRAEPIAQQVIEDRIRLGAYMPDLESEWTTVQAGTESPGRVDAMVWLAYDLLRPPSTGQPIAPPSSVDRRDIQRNPADPNGIVGRRIIRNDPGR